MLLPLTIPTCHRYCTYLPLQTYHYSQSLSRLLAHLFIAISIALTSLVKISLQTVMGAATSYWPTINIYSHQYTYHYINIYIIIVIFIIILTFTFPFLHGLDDNFTETDFFPTTGCWSPTHHMFGLWNNSMDMLSWKIGNQLLCLYGWWHFIYNEQALLSVTWLVENVKLQMVDAISLFLNYISIIVQVTQLVVLARKRAWKLLKWYRSLWKWNTSWLLFCKTHMSNWEDILLE